MKNLLKVFAVVLAVMALSIAAVGCSVNGRTYVYDSIKITRPENAQYQFEDDEAYASLFNKDVYFSEDGSLYVGDVYSGFYKVVGGKIYVAHTNKIETEGVDPVFYIEGSNIVVKKTLADGVYVEATFVRK